MPCPTDPPLFDHYKYIWRRIQVMQLLIMQYSPTFYYFILLWPKYSPEQRSQMPSVLIELTNAGTTKSRRRPQ
jgi:hypothetical protein